MSLETLLRSSLALILLVSSVPLLCYLLVLSRPTSFHSCSDVYPKLSIRLHSCSDVSRDSFMSLPAATASATHQDFTASFYAFKNNNNNSTANGTDSCWMCIRWAHCDPFNPSRGSFGRALLRAYYEYLFGSPVRQSVKRVSSCPASRHQVSRWGRG